MHIGIDARFVQGPNTGVTNYLLNLLSGISRVDRDNTYSIFLSDPAYINRVPQARNFRVRLNTANALIWKNLWLPQEVKRLGIDCFHFPAYTASFANIGKNVVTIPDVIHKVNPDWFSFKERILLSLPINLAIKKADRIIAISQSTKRDIMKYYNVPDEKISVTLLAADESFRQIDEPSIKEYIKRKYAIDSDYILNIGVLFKRRNLERLLEAFSILKKNSGIKHKLVIAGPGREYFNLGEYIARYGLKQEVIYLGYIQQDDLPLLYNAALFFVYPSLYEGFGLPVLEAMSCGKAVIASKTSSLPEVVGDAGILVDPFKKEEFYQAMHRLIIDEGLRNELAMKGLKRAELFSWDSLAAETVSIYKSFDGHKNAV
jgi:glycosyltransferase involved in cell wall biosynthesis